MGAHGPRTTNPINDRPITDPTARADGFNPGISNLDVFLMAASKAVNLGSIVAGSAVFGPEEAKTGKLWKPRCFPLHHPCVSACAHDKYVRVACILLIASVLG